MSREAKLKIIQAFDDGEITEEEARDLISRADAVSATPPSKQSVVDEMHPDISMKDRLLFKNFGKDSSSGINFLQKQYPDLEFKTDEKDRILAKRRDEGEWRKLDPSSFELADIGDAAFDVGAGILETGASALGGIAGAVGGTALAPGVGTALGGAGGAAAAGGAAGAGLETARQSLGQFFGVSDEFDTDQIKTAGIFGAAAPLLLGTGAAGKQVVKGVAKMSSGTLGKKAAAKAGDDLLANVAKAQQGLIGRGFRAGKSAVFPRVGQAVSGIEKDTLQYAANNLDKIKAAEDAYGQVAIYDDLAGQLQDAHSQSKEILSQQYGDALDALNVEIPVDAVEKPLADLLQKYEQRAMQSIEKFGDQAPLRAEFKAYEHLKGIMEEYAEGSGVLTGRQAQEYLNRLNDITQIRKNVNVGKKSTVDREIINASKQVAKNVDAAISQFDTGKNLKAVKGEYQKMLSREDQLKKFFKDEETTERTLNSLMSPKKNAQRRKVMTLADDLGVDVTETARESIANSIFAKPSEDLLSLGGTTSTSRTIPLSVAGSAGGYYLSSQLGDGHGSGVAGATIGGLLGARAGSPATLRRIMQMNDFVNRQGGRVQNMGPGVLPAVPQSTFNIYRQLLMNER